MSPIVHQGQDGWLFLTGGSNFVVHLYERDAGHLPDSALAIWRDAIIDRKRRCEALGIAYAHLVVPEKITIYGHKLARPIVDPDLAPVVRLSEMLEEQFAASSSVDLVAPLRALRDEADLYWRTDTHWTPAGFRIAHGALCDHLNFARPDDLEDRSIAEGGRLMDLGAKLDPPVWEHVRDVSWLRNATRVFENEVAQLLETPSYGGAIHVGSRAVYENPKAPNKGRLMIFGDSFSSVGANALTAMLAETVERVDFVWASNVDWGLVKRERPDVLVTQMAERYMAIPPRAGFNLRSTEFRQVLTARRRNVEAWLRAARERLHRSIRLP